MVFHRHTSILIVLMAIVILASEIHLSSAKQRSWRKLLYIPYKKSSRTIRTGGCSAFGHSCFGGHGKRTDGNAVLIPGPDSDQQPLLVFRPEEEDADDAMVQQGALPSAWSATAGISPRQPPPLPAKYNLTPFLRQWFQALRHSTGDVEAK
ncbi:uncharacterized protein LOC110840119 isoform X2 [Zootermopsis nevadensis]|uniref:uncharacterized protein LOC110840119 isoform X2 n=1 Tax=Zootermopsis nevadensis TaxID=136037 RepID=UPI000B8E2801|nr:uncharacterized protein LOC110840119 isoform X2 [Zootermopsis nevadensis]